MYDNKPVINWSISVLVLIEIKVVMTLPLSISTRFHFICKNVLKSVYIVECEIIISPKIIGVLVRHSTKNVSLNNSHNINFSFLFIF